jgi:DNA-binding NarL/FixJ family response regulator
MVKAQRRTHAAPADDRIRCLVGDPHRDRCREVVAALKQEPRVEVVGQAVNGAEALRLAERRRPDVAIVDVALPGVDGVEFTRRVRATERPPAVVLATDFDGLDLLDAGLEAGALGFVLRTATPNFLRAVRSVAAGQPYVDVGLTGALLTRGARHDRPPLSQREAEVLQLLADGLTTQAVGEALHLSPTTVRSYGESAMRKLHADNRVHAVALALRLRLIE